MAALVSILIPVYNRQSIIAETLDSALAQSYSNIEVVVVDNASTDGTWEVVQGYAQKDSRVKAFRNETNIGPVRNWLRCAKEARGEYSKILFSDDLMAPEYIARALPLLHDPSVAFVYTAAYIGETMGEGIVAYAKNLKHQYPIAEYFPQLKQVSVPYSPGAAIFRTVDIRKNLHDTFPTSSPCEFWRHGAGPDVMLYALTALEYPLVAFVNEPLVFFRDHAQSITIINANNEIIDGYRSALSWFFARYLSRSDWIDYVAWQWLSEVRRRGSWVNPVDFTKDYEGTGSLKEEIQLGRRAIILMFSRLWKKIRSRFGTIAGAGGIS